MESFSDLLLRDRGLARPPELHPVLAYALAVAITVFAFAIQHELLPSVRPFILFFLAVFLASWFGGRGPGFISMALAAVLADYHFIPPDDRWSLSPKALLLIGLFLLVSTVVNLLSGGLRMAMKRTEASARLLRTVVGQLPAGIVIADALGRVQFANPQNRRIFVHNASQSGDSGDWQGLRPGGAPYGKEEWPLFRSVASGEIVSGEEIEIRTIDGTRRFIVANSAPLIDSRGRIIGAVAIDVDVTDNRIAQEKLRYQLDLNRNITDNAAEAIFVTDHQGRITLANKEAERLFGFSQSELVGRSLHDTLHHHRLDGQPFPASECLLARIHHDAEPVRGSEEVFFRRDGLPVDVVCSSSFLEVHGRRIGSVLVARDISERKRIEESLREADRRKDEFLAVLSHELRNPLAPIQNSLFVLEHTPTDEERGRRARAVIGRQVNHLTRLVEDLLDVTRVARGKIRLRRERVDLVQLVRRTAEDQRSVFVHGGLTLTVETPDEPLWISGDSVRLAQVLGNLLQNAAKFTPAGGRTWVRIEGAPAGSEAVIRVADTGVGIAPGLMSKLFQPFAQAEMTLARSKGGLGLGLALVKALVEMHGGSVRAQSDGPGRGAEFVVRLPRGAEIEASETPPARRERGTQPRRVLIIEDMVDAAESLRTALELNPNNLVQVAYSGLDGLAAARRFLPDVVLCDIGLPGMDGYEVARAMRADDALRSIQLVALTGYALPDDQNRAAQAGFDRHLAKPPDMVELEEAISQGAGRAV